MRHGRGPVAARAYGEHRDSAGRHKVTPPLTHRFAKFSLEINLGDTKDVQNS